jgi:sigma-B regulation protein RsbU (phosphoserine phosphatase)
MLSKSSFKINNIQKEIVFYIIAITIPMFLISLYYIQKTASTELTKSEYRQAQLINLNTLKNIENFLNKTSAFTVKAAYMITSNPEYYKKILPFLKENIERDPTVYGSALALEPDSPLKKLYCKYFYRGKDSLREKWLMPPKYDYLHSAWYYKVKQSGKPAWSEPYFDKGGGEVYMSTYSYPVFDLKHHFLGVVTADVKLNTLSRKIQQLAKNKVEHIFLVSKSGFLLSHPNRKFNLKQTIFKYADFIGSRELKTAGEDMIRGKSGTYSIRLPDGKYTLYTMYVSQTAWSIGIFLKDKILFRPLDKLKRWLLLIMFVDIVLILLMVLIVSNKLKKNVAREEKIKNEFILASRIQQQFLPEKEEIEEKHFTLSGVMLPAKEVGGDFYGYKMIKEKIIFYVGDVSGKGVPASLFMMASQMLIEDAIDEKCDPAYVLDKVNKKLSNISTTGMFATMIVGMIDLTTMELTFSVAGHPPFIINANGAIYSPLTIFAPPVATFEDFTYQNSKIKLKENTTIVAFSDGVSEAENSKREFFGTERIARTLLNMENESVVAIKGKLLKDIQAFTRGQEQSDDLTIVVVRV